MALEKTEILEYQDVPKELKKQRVRRKILKIFPYYQLIAVVLVIIGCASWFALPMMVKHTYISENALMPGQGESKFNNFDAVNQYYDKLKNNVTLNDAYALISKDPLHRLYAKHDQYIILRTISPRGDGSESILLYTSLKSPWSCALLLAYYHDLQNRNYLAKDVLILITNNEPKGSWQFVQDWYNSNKNILWQRPGEIQVALGLFIDSNRFDTFNIKFTGHQPRLPNLDIINTIVRISQMYNLRTSVHGDMGIGGNSYFDYLRRMLYMGNSLIVGDLNEYSAHSNFGSVGLDAVTIHCTNLNTTGTLYDGNGGQVYKIHDLQHVVILLDAMNRAFNNLLEKFHQSFYFYILASHLHYVSIADMAIPIGILLVSLLLTAFALWYYSDSGYEYQKYIPRHTSQSRPVILILKTVVIPLAVTTVLFGGISFVKSLKLVPDNILFPIHTVLSMLVHILFILKSEDVLEMLLPDFYVNKYQQTYWMMFKCFLCIGTICYLFAISTLNYFLSAFMTTILVPTLVLIGPPKSNTHKTVLNIILLTASASGVFLASQTIYQINWSVLLDILNIAGLDVSALLLIKPVNMPELWLGLFQKWFRFSNPFYPSLFILHQAVILGCVIVVNGFEFNMTG